MAKKLKSSGNSLAKPNREIQERQQAEAKLMQTEKLALLGKVARLLSHELRNPLSVIKNAVFFLEEEGKHIDDQARKDYLEIISKNTDKAIKIINDTLNFAQPKRVQLGKYKLSKIIEEVIQDVALPERISLERHYHNDREIDIDPVQINQLFHNLFLNAIQAITGTGRIKIDIKKQRDYIKVQIADTGVGIGKDELPRIFEPLFTTKAKGIGLGLNVVKDIVEAHKGKIAIESESGKGTIVSIRLPGDHEKSNSYCR